VQFLNIKNNSIAYYCQDNGHNGSIIFVHGAGGTHKKWINQLEVCFNGFVTTALDLPGHGASGGKPCSTIEEYAEVVLDFATALQLPEPWIIAGHSLGGAVALQTGLSNCPSVGGLILVATGAKLKVYPHFLDELKQGIVKKGFLRKGYGSIKPQTWIEEQVSEYLQVSSHVLYNDFITCDKFDIKEHLNNISVPCLIVVGEEDNSTPPKYSHYLQEHLPQAELVKIPGAGHHIMLEASGIVNKAIKTYLRNNFLDKSFQ